MINRIVPSPIGRIRLTADQGAIVGLHLHEPPYAADDPVSDGTARDHPSSPADEDCLDRAATQLDEYFAGTRDDFDLPLRLDGTPFQREVWDQLLQIPYGTVISYGELARRVGRPGAARAVGSANGANPVAVIVPCHRVIAADGGLGGYGYGIERKRVLLDLEGPEPEAAQLQLAT